MGLEELPGRVAGRFGRVEPRRRARAFVLGLLADLPRKNCWTIAEHAGQATPDGMRHLLAGAVWDHDAVRDDVRDYLVDYLCAGPAGLPLVALVRVAGTRWRVEEAFQAAKGLCGLDQHQVRRWCSWYRWVTLAMLASAFLVVAAVTEQARHRWGSSP